MLHATLHGKLGLLTPEAQRLEDAVTSTVFGTLAMVERWDVISRWLTGSADASSGGNNEIWFWPMFRTSRYTSIPDVCVRLGNRFIVVEAKYGSGRNDAAFVPETPEQVCDQLVRQYMCASAKPPDRIAYADDIRRSLDECDVSQAFLVDARRLRGARAEFQESCQREPGMSISLVTWQRLDRLLYEHHVLERWARELRRFLALAGLNAFVGFGRLVAASSSGLLLGWGSRGRADMAGLRASMVPTRSVRPGRIQQWRPSGSSRSSHGRNEQG